MTQKAPCPELLPFERGPGPLVSVLLPTRGRPRWFCEAVCSLWSLARHKEWLELVVKADDDDGPTLELLAGLKDTGLPLKAVVSPRGTGYMEMHHWLNWMAGRAEGDWLFVFNDDARMMSQDWDLVVAGFSRGSLWHQLSDFCMVVVPTLDRPFANEFFLLRRKVYDVLGHLSLNPHTDTWLNLVMSMCGSSRRAHEDHIRVRHLSDQADDDVRRESKAAYGPAGEHLNSLPMIRERVRDVNLVLDAIERQLGRG